MNQIIPARSGRKAFAARRLALLASAAGLAIAVVAAGASGFLGMDVPESLKKRMALYKSHGRIFREASELFTEVSWLQVMHGQGLVPQGYNPLVDIYPEAEIGSFLESIRSVIGKCVEVMPTHRDFINQHCAAPRP